MSERAWLTRHCSAISVPPFMLLIICLFFESILMDILPLFAALQYCRVLYWPGIAIPAAMLHPRNATESTVDKIFVVIRSSGKSGLGVLSGAIVVPVRNKYTGALAVTWCYCYVVASVYCGAKSGASYPYGAPIPVLVRFILISHLPPSSSSSSSPARSLSGSPVLRKTARASGDARTARGSRATMRSCVDFKSMLADALRTWKDLIVERRRASLRARRRRGCSVPSEEDESHAALAACSTTKAMSWT